MLRGVTSVPGRCSVVLKAAPACVVVDEVLDAVVTGDDALHGVVTAWDVVGPEVENPAAVSACELAEAASGDVEIRDESSVLCVGVVVVSVLEVGRMDEVDGGTDELAEVLKASPIIRVSAVLNDVVPDCDAVGIEVGRAAAV